MMKLAQVKFVAIVAMILMIRGGLGAGISMVALARGQSAATPPATTVQATPTSARYIQDYEVHDLLGHFPDFDNVPVVGAQEDASSTTRPAMPPKVSAQALSDRLVKSVRAMVIDDPAATVAMAGQTRLRVNASAEAQKRVQTLIELAGRERTSVISIESRFLSIDAKTLESTEPDLRKLYEAAIISGRTVSITELQRAALLKKTGDEVATNKFSTLPHFTLFQNQHAYLEIGTSTGYVRDFTVNTDGHGEPVFKAVVDTVLDGVVMDARASCDVDAATVSLDYRAQVGELRGMVLQRWAKAPVGQNLNVQVPDVQVISSRQLVTLAAGQSALIWVGKMDGAKDKPATDCFTIVTPTIRARPQSGGEL